MEILSILIFVLVGISQAQEDEKLTVKFANSETRTVSLGSNLSFMCRINRGLMYTLSSYVEMIRQYENGSELVLTQQTRREGADPKHYSVEIDPNEPNAMNVKFNINDVRDVDEGHLICRASSEDRSTEVEEDRVEIIIQRPLDKLYLKFDDYTPVSKEVATPIEIDRGNHTVTCIAEGSNPAATEVHLYFNDLQIYEVKRETNRMVAEVKKFRTTVKGNVFLTAKDSNKNYDCFASSPLGIKHTVRLPIKIKVSDPKITCNDSDAYRGKPYPILTCLVDYEGFKIKGFRYELGTKESIQEGNQNRNFVEVSRKQLSETRAEVLLNLYKAEDWHFSTEFYLVAEHEDGHESRATVKLSQIPENETEEDAEKGRGASRDSNNSCSFLGASVATLIFSLWSALHLRL